MKAELHSDDFRSNTIKNVYIALIGISIAFLFFNPYFWYIAYSNYYDMQRKEA